MLIEDWRQDYDHDWLRCALGMTIRKPVRDRLLDAGHPGRELCVPGRALQLGVRPGADLAPIRSVHGPAVTYERSEQPVRRSGRPSWARRSTRFLAQPALSEERPVNSAAFYGLLAPDGCRSGG